MEKIALGIIDAQRGFMPAGEGERLGMPGFGELAIKDGEQIVEPINRLLGAFAAAKAFLFTTQDWHPAETAHFSDNPNFKDTWPVHCVADTPGAELHPGIILPAATERFVKGTTALLRGEDDTSYSGYYAHSAEHGGLSLPTRLREIGTTKLVLAGLALDYCLGLTALDAKNKMGLDVTVVTDATRAVAGESSQRMREQLEANGITLATTDEVIRSLRAE